VAVLDAIVVPDCDPSTMLGLELHLMEAVGARKSPPTLIVFGRGGQAARAISLGRYHLYASPKERGGVRAYRRLTGGRIVGAGTGWLVVALILPSRSALLRAEDAGLKADQVMNRCVRGLLGAMRALGLDCFYPGRDAITVARREIAMCSFETDASGAILFEAALAMGRGMEELAHDLERFDPDGALTSAMYDRETATTLARELGREVSFGEAADAVVAGYGALAGEIRRRDLTAAEREESARRGAALNAAGWLNDRKPDPALDRTSRAGAQLGFVEARLRLGESGAIERVMIAGDFIANSPGLARFESELRGHPLDLPTVTAAAVRTFGDGANYFLGMGDLANLVSLVMKA
jgi:lipoate-protein ligase A